MNRLIKGFRAVGRIAKACLGLPYVPIGILMMLAFSWFNQPPDLMLTATLVLAFPVFMAVQAPMRAGTKLLQETVPRRQKIPANNKPNKRLDGCSEKLSLMQQTSFPRERFLSLLCN